MDNEVQAAELLVDAAEHRRDVLVGTDVARQHQRRLREALREVVDVLFEAALIGEREPGAAIGRRLRNGPRKRPFVGDANNESQFSSEITHARLGFGSWDLGFGV